MSAVMLMQGDCCEKLNEIQAHSVNLVLADPPYGITHQAWDTVLPFEDFIEKDGKRLSLTEFLLSCYKAGISYADTMSIWTQNKQQGIWKRLDRILTENGAVILFSAGAYTKTLMDSKVAESLTLLQAAKDAEKKKVDTREWGEFRVGELFAQERGKEKAPKQNEPGDCPLIQETNNNNGFDRMVAPTKIIKGNAITVSINYAQNVFYQADDFCASVNIAVLRNNHLNRYNSQFVCSVLRNVHQKFDYTSKISKELLNKETIMLPVDKTGQPDWGYMEEYMTKMEERVKATMGKYEMTVNEVAL